MTTYNEIANELVQDGNTEYYRFQGHNSFDYFDIRKNRFVTNSAHYVYFSRTEDHHYYFTIRRIRQLLNAVVLRDTPYLLSRKQLKAEDSYHHIRDLVINSEKIRGLTSIKLVCDPNYNTFLQENSVSNHSKTINQGIERVDRRVYGGGYGVTGPWLDLWNDLTYFTSCSRITTQDILSLLEEMKRGNSQSNPKLIKKALEQKERTYRIVPNLYNDFHRYSIMDDLERIYEQGLFLPTSTFATNPKETMRGILSSYQVTREKVLRKIDDRYHKI